MGTGFAVPSRVMRVSTLSRPSASGRRCLSPFFNRPLAGETLAVRTHELKDCETGNMQAYRQHVRENMLLALDTLRTHKFRSFLTVLGVLIGTTTVIAVTSIIAGLDKQLVDVAEQFGTRTLWVYKLQLGAPHAMTREERLRRPLSYEDAMAIKEQCPSTETV